MPPMFNENVKSVLPTLPAPGQSVNAVILESTTDAIVARAGGGQGLATPLTAKFNRVATVATTADSVLLPAALAGMAVRVRNDGANAMNVYPQNNGDIINALAVNTAFSQAAAGLTVVYVCYTTGKWTTS